MEGCAACINNSLRQQNNLQESFTNPDPTDIPRPSQTEIPNYLIHMTRYRSQIRISY